MTRMAEDHKMLDNCRSAIKHLLADHVKLPLLNMREEDFRASLFGELRRAFPNYVPVEILDKRCNPVVATNQDKAVTSRVHAEVAVTEIGKAVFDLVILRDSPVKYTTKRGLTDVLKTVSASDVVVAIEVKAAPANYPSISEGIKKDITKLSKLCKRVPHVHCFLVIIDKTLALGLGVEEISDSERQKWLRRFLQGETIRGQIEVWYLDSNPTSPVSLKEAVA